MPNLYEDFITHCATINAKFPCDAKRFYHHAEAFVLDPMFDGYDYEDDGFSLTPGWQFDMIRELCWQGMINENWSE